MSSVVVKASRQIEQSVYCSKSFGDSLDRTSYWIKLSYAGYAFFFPKITTIMTKQMQGQQQTRIKMIRPQMRKSKIQYRKKTITVKFPQHWLCCEAQKMKA